jgi:hypothetical protein
LPTALQSRQLSGASVAIPDMRDARGGQVSLNWPVVPAAL